MSGNDNGYDASGPRIESAFREFHKQNPSVYVMLLEYAKQAKRRGAKHMGIAMLWERLRWYVVVESNDSASPYKLNNNYRAHYARLLEESEPDLRGFFTTRRLRSWA